MLFYYKNLVYDVPVDAWLSSFELVAVEEFVNDRLKL